MFFISEILHTFLKKDSTFLREQIKFSKQEFFFIKSHPVFIRGDRVFWKKGIRSNFQKICYFPSANLNIFYVLMCFLLLLDL